MNKLFCPVCGKYSDEFKPYGLVPRKNAMCPYCRALERDRFSWLFIESRGLLSDDKNKMLHIAPEKELEKKFKMFFKENYLSADLQNKAMVKMDITDIHFEDNSFDCIYCSHVLEHIIDDRKAISELNRVLKFGGWAILNVPVNAKNETEEDFSITDPKERERLYGQWDHVRNYGYDYIDRLREGGFDVEVIKPQDCFDDDLIQKTALSFASGEIFFCKKRDKSVFPLVSIVIPTHNRSNLLIRAINSCLKQTYPNIEIIISDDASNDDTKSVVLKLQKTYGDIIYIRNNTNQGGNVARNLGIKASNGKFITFLDDDDEFLEYRIKMLVENYDEKYAFVISNVIRLGENTNSFSDLPSIVDIKDIILSNRISNTILTTKNKMLRAGLFDEELIAFQDDEMWVRLILNFGKAKCLYIPTSIMHQESNNRISKNPKKYIGYIKFYKKYKNIIDNDTREFMLKKIYCYKQVSLHPNKTYIDVEIKCLETKLIKMNIKELNVCCIGGYFSKLYPVLIQNNIKILNLIDTKLAGQVRYGKKILSIDEFAKTQGGYVFIASDSFFYDVKMLLIKKCKNYILL